MKRRHRFEIAAAPAITTVPPRPAARPTEASRRQASWLAQATGFTVGFIIAIACLVTEKPWDMALLWIAVAGLGSASIVFLVLSWLFVLLRLRRWSREGQEEQGLGGDQTTNQRASTRREITVNVEEKGRIDRCLLFSPESRPAGLAFYAAALIRDDDTRAAFSYSGGKHINGAQFYGYNPTEFEELEKEAKRAGLVHRQYKNQPYILTERGRVVLKRVAEREMSEIQLSPTP